MKTQNRSSEIGDRSSETVTIIMPRATGKTEGALGDYIKRIGMRRDDPHASRRFFNQHKHVMREEGGIYQELLILILILVSGCLVTALDITRAELRERDEAIAHFEQQHVIQSHIMQTNALTREVALPTNGGGM